VTPQITPEGSVILDVDVNKDSVGQATASGVALNTKHVKTQVLVENGETVVLGGIFTSTNNKDQTKVPFFGDLPYFGHLFKRTSVEQKKRELLIFVTPKILKESLSLSQK
jgi:type IV pilus assembly protein PilQ